jgi:uncharacterized hydrophobic protein (TIGR00341 family)
VVQTSLPGLAGLHAAADGGRTGTVCRMTLRFMQIFIPEDPDLDLSGLLEDREILGTWRDASAENRLVIHLLVPTEETEPVMDRFEQAFGDVEGFHIVLFPVEAVLPRPEVLDQSAPPPEEVNRQATETFEEPGRVSREELYTDIAATLGINRVYVAMILLSSIVAAVGLMRDDVAVIIGAMVIAPLLGPNVAMSLATTLGDLGLLRSAVLTNAVGIVLALLTALVVGAAFHVDPAVPAIAARTQLKIDSLALALAAGAAGTFAFTRGLSGAVIGVMVAVALMPPLIVFGMLLGAGDFLPAGGALLLLVANIVCINLAGVATFLAQGVRPRTWWEEERARKASRTAIAIWCVLLAALVVIVYITQTSGSLGI